jgi:uncharacterized protein (DUF1015 family)
LILVPAPPTIPRMAHVAPFRGIRFAPARVPDLSRVVAPPYDVISPDFQRELLARHPRNIVHVDFGLPEPGDEPGRDRYARAAARLREWLADGTFARDPRPSLYLYEQEFEIAGLGRFVRRGFLGALRLSPFGDGVVFPHERTLSAPKADRLALLRATETDTSPVFALYSDPADAALAALRAQAGRPPDMTAADDAGIAHRAWRIDDPAALAAVAGDLAERRIFIADGHHRYETTLGWRDEQRARTGGRVDAAGEFILAFLCNMDAPGLVILPTHRGVHSLPQFSADELLAHLRAEVPVETREGSPEDACTAAAEAGRHGKALAWAAGPGRYHVVSFPDVERLAARLLPDVPAPLRTLDVVLLHELLFRRMLGIDHQEVTRGRFVRYYKEARKAAAELRAGELQAAFFLNPVTTEEFRRVSLSGHVLPQKTTFFYPKVLTGLVLLSAHPEDSIPG